MEVNPDRTSHRSYVNSKRSIPDCDDHEQPQQKKPFHKQRVAYLSRGQKRRQRHRQWGLKPDFSDKVTLELRNIPKEWNNIKNIGTHFATFGTLTNIQIKYDGDPEAALVSFANNTQAYAAYNGPLPIFNNRYRPINVYFKRYYQGACEPRKSAIERLGKRRTHEPPDINESIKIPALDHMVSLANAAPRQSAEQRLGKQTTQTHPGPEQTAKTHAGPQSEHQRYPEPKEPIEIAASHMASLANSNKQQAAAQSAQVLANKDARNFSQNEHSTSGSNMKEFKPLLTYSVIQPDGARNHMEIETNTAAKTAISKPDQIVGNQASVQRICSSLQDKTAESCATGGGNKRMEAKEDEKNISDIDPPLETGKGDTSHKTGNTDTLHETGNADVTRKTGNADTPHETGNADTTRETGNVDTPHETSNADTIGETGNADTPRETGKADTTLETGDADTPHETYNADTPHETGNADTTRETGDVGTPHETGDADTTGETGDADTSHETSSAYTTRKTGKADTTCETGNVDTPHEPADVDTPHETGDAIIPHETGDADTPHETGNTDTPPETGDADIPHETGDADTPHATCNTDTPHETGDADIPHETGDADIPHETGGDIPHKTGDADITRETGYTTTLNQTEEYSKLITDNSYKMFTRVTVNSGKTVPRIKFNSSPSVKSVRTGAPHTLNSSPSKNSGKTGAPITVIFSPFVNSNKTDAPVTVKVSLSSNSDNTCSPNTVNSSPSANPDKIDAPITEIASLSAKSDKTDTPINSNTNKVNVSYIATPGFPDRVVNECRPSSHTPITLKTTGNTPHRPDLTTTSSPDVSKISARASNVNEKMRRISLALQDILKSSVAEQSSTKRSPGLSTQTGKLITYKYTDGKPADVSNTSTATPQAPKPVSSTQKTYKPAIFTSQTPNVITYESVLLNTVTGPKGTVNDEQAINGSRPHQLMEASQFTKQLTAINYAITSTQVSNSNPFIAFDSNSENVKNEEPPQLKRRVVIPSDTPKATNIFSDQKNKIPKVNNDSSQSNDDSAIDNEEDLDLHNKITRSNSIAVVLGWLSGTPAEFNKPKSKKKKKMKTTNIEPVIKKESKTTEFDSKNVEMNLDNPNTRRVCNSSLLNDKTAEPGSGGKTIKQETDENENNIYDADMPHSTFEVTTTGKGNTPSNFVTVNSRNYSTPIKVASEQLVTTTTRNTDKTDTPISLHPRLSINSNKTRTPITVNPTSFVNSDKTDTSITVYSSPSVSYDLTHTPITVNSSPSVYSDKTDTPLAVDSSPAVNFYQTHTPITVYPSPSVYSDKIGTPIAVDSSPSVNFHQTHTPITVYSSPSVYSDNIDTPIAVDFSPSVNSNKTGTPITVNSSPSVNSDKISTPITVNFRPSVNSVKTGILVTANPSTNEIDISGIATPSSEDRNIHGPRPSEPGFTTRQSPRCKIIQTPAVYIAASNASPQTGVETTTLSSLNPPTIQRKQYLQSIKQLAVHLSTGKKSHTGEDAILPNPFRDDNMEETCQTRQSSDPLSGETTLPTGLFSLQPTALDVYDTEEKDGPLIHEIKTCSVDRCWAPLAEIFVNCARSGEITTRHKKVIMRTLLEDTKMVRDNFRVFIDTVMNKVSWNQHDMQLQLESLITEGCWQLRNDSQWMSLHHVMEIAQQVGMPIASMVLQNHLNDVERQYLSIARCVDRKDCSDCQMILSENHWFLANPDRKNRLVIYSMVVNMVIDQLNLSDSERVTRQHIQLVVSVLNKIQNTTKKDKEEMKHYTKFLTDFERAYDRVMTFCLHLDSPSMCVEVWKSNCDMFKLKLNTLRELICMLHKHSDTQSDLLDTAVDLVDSAIKRQLYPSQTLDNLLTNGGHITLWSCMGQSDMFIVIYHYLCCMMDIYKTAKRNNQFVHNEAFNLVLYMEVLDSKHKARNAYPRNISASTARAKKRLENVLSSYFDPPLKYLFENDMKVSVFLFSIRNLLEIMWYRSQPKGGSLDNPPWTTCHVLKQVEKLIDYWRSVSTADNLRKQLLSHDSTHVPSLLDIDITPTRNLLEVMRYQSQPKGGAPDHPPWATCQAQKQIEKLINDKFVSTADNLRKQLLSGGNTHVSHDNYDITKTQVTRPAQKGSLECQPSTDSWDFNDIIPEKFIVNYKHLGSETIEADPDDRSDGLTVSSPNLPPMLPQGFTYQREELQSLGNPCCFQDDHQWSLLGVPPSLEITASFTPSQHANMARLPPPSDVSKQTNFSVPLPFPLPPPPRLPPRSSNDNHENAANVATVTPVSVAGAFGSKPITGLPIPESPLGDVYRESISSAINTIRGITYDSINALSPDPYPGLLRPTHKDWNPGPSHTEKKGSPKKSGKKTALTKALLKTLVSELKNPEKIVDIIDMFDDGEGVE